MALNETQQIQKILEKSKYILLLFNSKDNGDALSSALAMKIFLEKQHKQADIICPDFTVQKSLNFLPLIQSIKPALSNLQKFIIKVDVSKAKMESLSYDIKDSTLYIYLAPKEGILSKNELRTAQSTFKYDLIITLNNPDLDSLGSVFHNNTDLFYRTSIINIDHLANNERYGQINLIDLSVTSTSEIVYKVIKELGEHLVDPALATTVLTGMTVATKSFKSQNISPFTLQTASELIAKGAEREKIIHHLYRTRSIATLKLWGEALTHLQTNPKLGLVWTTITREDFTRSGGKPEDLPGIIDELISNSPEAKVILVLYEIENGGKKIGGLLAAEKNFDAMHLAKPFAPEGNKHLAFFTLSGKSLKEAEEAIIQNISQALPQ